MPLLFCFGITGMLSEISHRNYSEYCLVQCKTANVVKLQLFFEALLRELCVTRDCVRDIAVEIGVVKKGGIIRSIFV